MGIDPSGLRTLLNIMVTSTIQSILQTMLIQKIMHVFDNVETGVLAGMDRELALLSQDVYNDGDGAPPNWERVKPTSISLDASKFGNQAAGGFFAALYKHRKFNFHVLAFRGTQALSVMDWLNNLGQGLGVKASQYEAAISLAIRVKRVMKGTFMLTGHSLGGGMASAAGLASNTNTVVFNPAGVNKRTLPAGINFAAADSLVTSYVVKGEILDYAQNGGLPTGVVAPDSVGRRIVLPSTFMFHSILHQIDLHSMDSVLGAGQ